AQSQCLAAQDGAHEQVLALNQAIAQHLTATAHQQAQLQLWRQQEQEISQEISQLAGLLGEAKAQQEARAHQQHTLAQTQADQAQALARLRDHKRLVAEQLERQQQALVALEGDLQAQKAQRLLVLNQQALMAGHIQQAAEQLAQRQATLDRFQQAPTAAPVDGRTPAAAHLAELEGQLQQLQARRAAIESEQTQVAQQLAYLAGRLGRQQESTERCDTAETSLVSDGPWLDTWAAAEAWLQPWISAQPWTDDWQAASRESNAPLFLIRPQADTLGIVQWLSSWQSAADRAVALAALKAQPEGVFYTPSGEVFARDWLYLPATGESRFSLPERLAHLARLRERQAELSGQLSAVDEQLAKYQAELAHQQAQVLREAALQEFQQASLASAEAECMQARKHHIALESAAAQLAEELARTEQSLQSLEGEQAVLLAQIAAGKAQLAELAVQEGSLSGECERLQAQSQALQMAADAALPVQQRLAEQHQQQLLKQQQIKQQIAQSLQQDAPLQRLQAQLAAAQGQLQGLKAQFASGEKQLKNLLLQERQLRQRQEQLRQDQEANKLNAQTLHTQLQGLQAEAFDINAALAMLPAHADSEQLQQQLADDKNALEALGPVNLAALEEYEQACARAAYLNEQQTDLHQALECLENAIK
ncbi:MAG TPA: hypothetical protein PKE57_05975, partial [Cellvibrionaceae bacterium]|nr:hypothetical protein [Cellvibrionaceae bacterium]